MEDYMGPQDTVEELEELNKDRCSLDATKLKSCDDADVYFVVDRDASPSEQQRTLIRLASKINKSLEYNFNIIIKEASTYKMYALLGMSTLYGYNVKVQQAYSDGSVPRGLYVVAEAGDDLTEVARTLQGLPSMGSIGCS